MDRYETKLEDQRLYVEGGSGWLEVGEMDTICSLVGGETYTIEYSDREATVSWLDTDEDGVLTFDVRETLQDVSYDEEFVRNLEQVPIDESGEGDHPKRTVYFADMMMRIWDAKGNLEG